MKEGAWIYIEEIKLKWVGNTKAKVILVTKISTVLIATKLDIIRRIARTHLSAFAAKKMDIKALYVQKKKA
jgi:hypothetical protein